MFPFAETIQPNNPMFQSQRRLLPSRAGAEASSCLGPERRTHGPASIMDTSHGGAGTAAVTAGAGGRPSWPQTEALAKLGAGRYVQEQGTQTAPAGVGCRPWRVVGPST